jgi:hypothetical protein
MSVILGYLDDLARCASFFSQLGSAYFLAGPCISVCPVMTVPSRLGPAIIRFPKPWTVEPIPSRYRVLTPGSPITRPTHIKADLPPFRAGGPHFVS